MVFLLKQLLPLEYFGCSKSRQLLLSYRLGSFQGTIIFKQYIQGNITKFHEQRRKGLGGQAVQNPDRKKNDMSQGAPKIRFEMMFNVRCLKCQNSIGKGVRFNAQKRTVGQYLSTKIYEFQMNCHLCSNRLVVRTDPKGCDYILYSGLEKRAASENPEQQQLAQSQIDQHKRRELIDNNAFYKLENANEDKLRADADIPRLQKILEIKQNNKDDFEWNKLLRKRMRENKQELIELEKEQQKPKNFGLEMIKTLEEKDQERVNQIRMYQSTNNYRKHKMIARDDIKRQSIFDKECKINDTVQKLPIDIRTKIQKMANSNKQQLSKKEEDQKSKILKHLDRINK
ncbi:UNKNOWN [Stylonychia lemnae]|uniref:Uncharacterized protein n=1 Tax=Stylonychia lemnae TaxID=5949 RepID=A0A078APL9_STYLE|nr:UNKNOWN [Stylonychia lemnae]|eukprot:CDW84099.1 UNKNOWN [Stylonychia lemnae]